MFGYYIEISKANLHLAPAEYDRKQTLVNAERYTTPELKEYEAKFWMRKRRSSRSSAAFCRVAHCIAGEAKRIRQTALALAEVDVLAALRISARAARITADRQFVDDRARWRSLTAGTQSLSSRRWWERASGSCPMICI